MIWLLLNILVSGFLYVIFRFFPKYGVDTLVAVIINYITAASCGLILTDFNPAEIISSSWFPIATSMGLLFIFIFILMAQSSQVNGISITSVANKMSLVIPVIAGVFLYGDQLNFVICLGIILALIGVWFTSKNEENNNYSRNGWLVLIALFFGSGLIDTLVKFVQENHLRENENASFVMVIFFSAACFGILWMLMSDRSRFRNFSKNSILAGIVLGIPNFCSIFFLVQALDKSGLNSAVLYPVNNMGIVAVSALFGVLIFKEKLSVLNLAGIGISIVAIALIAFG